MLRSVRQAVVPFAFLATTTCQSLDSASRVKLMPPASGSGSAATVQGPGSGAEPAAITVAVLNLAVVDNSAQGDSKQLAAWFREQRIDPTDLLRAEIAKPETYAALESVPTVVTVDGARIAEAIAESGVPPAECATECAISVGRAVGADRVVTGEVTKISNLIWFVTAGVVDVRTGRILRRDEFEVKGVIQDTLPRVMASLSRRFIVAT